MAKLLLLILLIGLPAHATLEEPTCAGLHAGLGEQLGNTTEVLDLAPRALPASRSAVKKEAGIYGDESRQLMKVDEFPWRAIAQLKLGGEICTAVMIDQCHALSAAHCLFTAENGKVKARRSSTKAKLISSNGAVSATVTEAVPGGDYMASGNNDYLFLRLDKPIGRQLGWMGIADVSGRDLENGWASWLLRRPGENLIIGGFNGDIQQGQVMSVDRKVEMVESGGEKGDLLRMRANTFLGSSGAPIWRFNAKSEPEIVGVNTKAIVTQGPFGPMQLKLPKDEKTNLAEGVSAHVFYERLQAYLKKSPCPP